MRFWVDAQLPSQLAAWLSSQFQMEAATLDALGLRHASDAAIFAALRKPGEVIITKDDDFVDLVSRLNPPPQVIWVTCGNVTNRAPHALFPQCFKNVVALLDSEEPLVELASNK